MTPATRVSAGERGLTLLELLVVMAILALLYAALPTGIFAGRSTIELRAVARDVAAGLRRARDTAIGRNGDVGFVVDLSERRYGVEGVGAAKRFPQSFVIEMQAAEAERNDENRAAIRFFPDGSSTGGSITVRLDERGYTVAVNWLTGHVSVVE